jgi:LAS superfamily LD-carboxypeptidase LdcB
MVWLLLLKKFVLMQLKTVQVVILQVKRMMKILGNFQVFGFNGLGLSIKLGRAFLFVLVFLNSYAQVSSNKLNAKDYKSFLLGKFNPDTCSNFVKVPLIYTQKDGIYLQKDAFVAFKRMFEAAKSDRIHLTILSSTRNFTYQKGIWERKWNSAGCASFKPGKDRANHIMKYSAMPGASRHHWGTDIDLNFLNNQSLSEGKGKLVYDWLKLNAGRFGFCQVYSVKDSNRPAGYEEEKWHWSFLPLAKGYTSDYGKIVKPDDINGFLGCESFMELSVVSNYVLGINPDCK